jgi:hypothetical protein
MKRPQWSLKCILAETILYANTWGDLKALVEEDPDIPDDAYISLSDYEMRAVWRRDMTDKEYEAEKKRRREKKLAEKERDRIQLERLAKKLGVKVVEEP